MQHTGELCELDSSMQVKALLQPVEGEHLAVPARTLGTQQTLSPQHAFCLKVR
jgi:hypothetical protein